MFCTRYGLDVVYEDNPLYNRTKYFLFIGIWIKFITVNIVGIALLV